MDLGLPELAGDECGTSMEPRLGLLTSQQGGRKPCVLVGHVLSQLMGKTEHEGKNNSTLVSLGTFSG